MFQGLLLCFFIVVFFYNFEIKEKETQNGRNKKDSNNRII